MAEIFSVIKTFSADELRDKVKKYITRLSQKYRDDASSGGKLIAETMKDGSYLSQLSQYQMQSVLAVEYIKFLLGKNTIQDSRLYHQPRRHESSPKRVMAVRPDVPVWRTISAY